MQMTKEMEQLMHAIANVRNEIVLVANRFIDQQRHLGLVKEDDLSHIVLMAQVAALADFIACAPEEQQGRIYKQSLLMLEQAYIGNLTKDNF